MEMCFLPLKITNKLILLVKINGAEGVVFESLLPSGDQGHKGGSHPLPDISTLTKGEPTARLGG
jgi:hypothetical protein